MKLIDPPSYSDLPDWLCSAQADEVDRSRPSQAPFQMLCWTLLAAIIVHGLLFLLPAPESRDNAVSMTTVVIELTSLSGPEKTLANASKKESPPVNDVSKPDGFSKPQTISDIPPKSDTVVSDPAVIAEVTPVTKPKDKTVAEDAQQVPSGISLLDNALAIARESASQREQGDTEIFDRRFAEALEEAGEFNQPGTYSKERIVSYQDHLGRQFVSLGKNACFELVESEMGLQEGKIWHFSSGCSGMEDKPFLSSDFSTN